MPRSVEEIVEALRKDESRSADDLLKKVYVACNNLPILDALQIIEGVASVLENDARKLRALAAKLLEKCVRH